MPYTITYASQDPYDTVITAETAEGALVIANKLAASYQELTRSSFASMRPTSPLSAPEPGRRPLELPELLPLSTRKAQNR